MSDVDKFAVRHWPLRRFWSRGRWEAIKARDVTPKPLLLADYAELEKKIVERMEGLGT